MEATPEDLNLGRWRPNLFSTPAKVAAAKRYPPTCSALMGGSSEMRDLGVGSDPEGRLDRREDEKMVKTEYGNFGALFTPPLVNFSAKFI